MESRPSETTPPRTPRLDELLDPLAFMRPEVVHDHHLPMKERGRKYLLDVGLEDALVIALSTTVHSPIPSFEQARYYRVNREKIT